MWHKSVFRYILYLSTHLLFTAQQESIDEAIRDGRIDPFELEDMAADVIDHYAGGQLPVVDIANMPPQEVVFHFFQNHDYDRNRALDGLELFKALTHEHGKGHEEMMSVGVAQAGSHRTVQTPDRIEETIDNMLTEYDYDDDGLFSYAEFAEQAQIARKVREIIS